MKTLIITGKKISELTPRALHPEACALWGVGSWNQRAWNGQLKDWTEWFDVHPPNAVEWFMGIRAVRPQTWAWYQAQSVDRPIWLLSQEPSIPASRAFPRAVIQRFFGTGPHLCTRFTCTVDWMLAKAIYDGYEKIIFNGIGVATGEMYQFQHKGILYWLGQCEARGIELSFDQPSVYTPPLLVYGYECGPPTTGRWPARPQKFQPRGTLALAHKRMAQRARLRRP
jgi:hypothetical protein